LASTPNPVARCRERARVEEPLDSLPRRHLALGVLAFHRSLRTGVHRLVPAALQVSDLASRRVQVDGGLVPGGL